VPAQALDRLGHRAALARVTGYSALTCRKAIQTLIREGVLVPGASPGAQPRVPLRGPTPGEQTQANAARALSSALASRRRAAGLTQPQLDLIDRITAEQWPAATPCTEWNGEIWSIISSG
jgi:hypothetical protein